MKGKNDMAEKLNDMRVWFFDFAEKENVRYFFSPQYNSIMKAFNVGGSVSVEKEITWMPYHGIGNYVGVELHHNKLIMPPFQHNTIDIYDIFTKEINSLALTHAHSAIYYKFVNKMKVENKIFLIPGRYPYFVVLDLDTNRLIEIPFDTVMLKEEMANTSTYFTKTGHIFKNTVYIAARYANVIIACSLNTNKLRYWNIGNAQGFHTLCGWGDKLYATDHEGKFYVISILEDNIEIEDCSYSEELNVERSGYALSIVFNGKCLIFTPQKEYIIGIDCVNYNISRYDLPQKQKSAFSGVGAFWVRIQDGNLHVMRADDFIEYIYDAEMQLIEKREFIINEKTIDMLNLCQFNTEQPGLYMTSLEAMLDRLLKKIEV